MSFECPPWPPRWPEIEQAVVRAVRSGQWGQYHSQIVADLAQRLKDYLSVQELRLCCSGTAALEIALRALRLEPGDEVLLAAYDFPGNLRTVELLGGRPVLVDVQPGTTTIDLQQVADEAGSKVKALIVSHLYGQACDVVGLQAICQQRGWFLIEDACQAVGMRIDGKPAGSFGDLATISFGGSKQLSAGNGGAVIANHDRLASRLGGLLDRPGDTFPLSPLAAAAIGPQLEQLDQLNARRNQAVEELIKHGGLSAELPILTGNDPKVSPSYYKVPMLAESREVRDCWIEQGKKSGLPIGSGYRSAARMNPRRCRKPVPLTNSEVLADRLCLLDHRALLAGAKSIVAAVA